MELVLIKHFDAKLMLVNFPRTTSKGALTGLEVMWGGTAFNTHVGSALFELFVVFDFAEMYHYLT